MGLGSLLARPAMIEDNDNRQSANDDEDARATPLGYFNVAVAYWRAAAALDSANLRTTHPHSPVRFLYYHAIELYLKSFLRMHGHSVKELRSFKFGHSTSRLKKRAEQLGLLFADEDVEVLSLMATTDAVIRSRYIQTGAYRWPTIEALERTCKSLHESTGQALKNTGIVVRL